MEGKEISVTLGFLICLTPENERVEKSIFSGREILRSSITKGYLTIQLDSDTTWVVASDFTSERAQFRKIGHISYSSCTWSAQATHTSVWPTTNSGVPTYPPPTLPFLPNWGSSGKKGSVGKGRDASCKMGS